MTSRQRLLTRLALSYAMSNLDDLCGLFDPELLGDTECPNCSCGTLAVENERLVCRGECGHDFGQANELLDYDGEIIARPTVEDFEEIVRELQG